MSIQVFLHKRFYWGTYARLFEVLQPFEVCHFLQTMRGTCPQAVARMLGDSDEARELVANNLKPSNHPLLVDFLENKAWIRECALFFDRLMDIDCDRLRSFPVVLLPFFLQEKATESAACLYIMHDQIPSHLRRPFFSLVFKLSTGAKHENCKVIENPLNWKPVMKEKDPMRAVYEQAGDALWDFIDDKELVTIHHLYRGKNKRGRETVFGIKEMKQEWTGWVSERRLQYENLADFLTNDAGRGRKNAHRVKIFIAFLMNYFSRSTMLGKYIKFEKVDT